MAKFRADLTLHKPIYVNGTKVTPVESTPGHVRLEIETPPGTAYERDMSDRGEIRLTIVARKD